MTSRPLSIVIICCFLVLIVFSLVYAIRAKSFTGIILALTSLGAGVHFINLLAKARRELQQEQEEAY